jgi:hypothetical protein
MELGCEALERRFSHEKRRSSDADQATEFLQTYAAAEQRREQANKQARQSVIAHLQKPTDVISDPITNQSQTPSPPDPGTGSTSPERPIAGDDDPAPPGKVFRRSCCSPGSKAMIMPLVLFWPMRGAVPSTHCGTENTVAVSAPRATVEAEMQEEVTMTNEPPAALKARLIKSRLV